MCGITGIFDTGGTRTIDLRLLEKMNETQHHRGPDEGELYSETALGFGHRRLSIIDLALGRQPLFNEDRSVVIVFNGEIYNYRALMSELSGLGHQFKTRSDTETIVHAWEQWGTDCLSRLTGMFAFAIWDRNQKMLFLARDHLGVKPLHYALLPDGLLVFGSELKSILANRSIARTLHARAIEDYFAFGYIPEPKTIYNDVFKLRPGHYLCVKVGDTAVRQMPYWDIPFRIDQQQRSQTDIEQELMERLTASVHSQMMSEVPLGAFLSGGVDSSAVVALMAQQNNQPVTTCSIGFADPEYDESSYASLVARRYHTEHHSELLGADSHHLVGRLAHLYDEPFADSSAIPTYRVCQLARQHVTVCLSGDGGDENFAGYRRYRYAMAEQKIRGQLPAWLRGPLFGTLGQIYPKADWAPQGLRAKTTFEALAEDLVGGYFHGVSVLPERQRALLFNRRFRTELQGYRALEVMREHALHAPTDDPLSLIQYLDFKTYLPGDILTKVDRASMAHSLEVRVPLLDHTFVEWISGLRSDLKLRGAEGKYIFKSALRPVLPDAILFRSKKGFSVPLASWFRGALQDQVRQAVLHPLMLEAGIFNQHYLYTLLDEHASGRKDNSAALWSLLMFSAFLQNSMGEQ